MADSEGTFGGDGSVFWRVEAKNVKRGSFECDVKTGVSISRFGSVRLFKPLLGVTPSALRSMP